MFVNNNNFIYILTVRISMGLELQRQKKQSAAFFVLTLIAVHRSSFVLQDLSCDSFKMMETMDSANSMCSVLPCEDHCAVSEGVLWSGLTARFR